MTHKIMIMPDGNPVSAPKTVPRGYGGTYPIVEVTGAEHVRPEIVLKAYRRCAVLPVMHADIPIPWDRLEGAQTGDIIRL